MLQENENDNKCTPSNFPQYICQVTQELNLNVCICIYICLCICICIVRGRPGLAPSRASVTRCEFCAALKYCAAGNGHWCTALQFSGK